MKELCKHFGICGGCDSQNIAYEEQLRAKEDRVKDILSPFSVKEIERIVPSPEIFHYRNKMEYAISNFEEDVLIGLRQKKRFYRIVDLEECPIFFDRARDVFNIFKTWIKNNNIQAYQLRRHSGNVRYAAMRHSKYYNELMVTIVLFSEEESINLLVDELKKTDFVKSVYLCINNGLADVSVTDNIRLLYGESRIKENINGIDYLIGPGSFFQTNSYCCGKLYDVIKDEVKNFKGQALDMCCGSGGITLQVAAHFDKVTGVDISAKNIEDALLNAGSNRIDNVEFICDDAESFFSKLKDSKEIEKFSTIILDPPRAGLSKKTKEIISASYVKNVVYVSCNPVTLAEDLKTLATAYRIERVIPIDMFPHTRHMEVVAILKRDKV